ncbi:MAG: hypothetical protein Q9170_002430 [Blastenia crenularia]
MFKVIAEPLNNEEVRVDMVFVHGLSDDWRSTWSKDGQDEVSWIEDFIPRDIPHTRIFACGRNILDGSQKYRLFPSDGLQEYESNRDTIKRPVIFLAHSLGGLILQAFLQQCTVPLRTSTKGIIFFGTPNLSWQEDQKTNFAAAMASLGHTVEPDYISNLGSISDQFARWVVDQKFAARMVCFYERLPVTGDVMIVDRGSNFLPCCDSRGLDASHMDMTKFESTSSTNYQTVLQCLRSMYCLADESMRVLLRHSLQPNSYGRLSKLPATPDGCEEFIASTQGNADIRDIGRLGLVAEDQGHYEKAEERYQAAINSLMTKGKCSAEITNLGHIAVALVKGCLDVETEEKFQRAAQSLQALDAPGSDDSAVLFCLHKWASLLCKRGLYKNAELYSKCCLEARLRISGNGSDSTLLTAANVMICLVQQNRHQEAYSILRNALENRNLALVNSSAEVPVLEVLAKLALEGGDDELAEVLSSDVLRKAIHLHGIKHPFTLNCMSGLADVLAQKGDLSRAEALSRRALNGLEHALGNDHPDCLRTACRLADYICAQQRYDDAALRHERILEKQQMRIGDKHPDTLLTMRSLGIDFALQRCWLDSEMLLDETLRGLTTYLGPENIQTTRTAEALRCVRDLQGERTHQKRSAESTLLAFLQPQPKIVSYNALTYAYSHSSFHTSIEGEVLQAVTSDDEEKLTNTLLNNSVTPAILGRALRGSAAKSQESMVRCLLSFNAPINGQSGYHGSALQAASLAGSVAVVELLLEHDVDIYHEGGILVNALRAAVFGGHEAILRLLLKSIAPGRPSQDVLNSSLQLALRIENPAMIDLILGAGADINARDELFGSPVQQASSYGQESIMTVQLRSADINMRGGIFSNPLQAALETQNESAVNRLLEAGATFRSSATDELPKGLISTHERQELAKILLKRLAYSLPQRTLSVDFGLWDPIQTPKQPVISWTNTEGIQNRSSSHLPQPISSEKYSHPKRVSTMKRMLPVRRGGGTTKVSNESSNMQSPRTRTKRNLSTLRRKLSGLT